MKNTKRFLSLVLALAMSLTIVLASTAKPATAENGWGHLYLFDEHFVLIPASEDITVSYLGATVKYYPGIKIPCVTKVTVGFEGKVITFMNTDMDVQELSYVSNGLGKDHFDFRWTAFGLHYVAFQVAYEDYVDPTTEEATTEAETEEATTEAETEEATTEAEEETEEATTEAEEEEETTKAEKATKAATTEDDGSNGDSEKMGDDSHTTLLWMGCMVAFMAAVALAIDAFMRKKEER